VYGKEHHTARQQKTLFCPFPGHTFSMATPNRFPTFTNLGKFLKINRNLWAAIGDYRLWFSS
jgi:hypothetical protein